MKQLAAILIFIILFSCNKPPQNVLSAKNLPSQTITVVADRDSVYRTAKGATLTIKKGTFNSDTKLEIKEAYTMQDIVLGGLTTTSNGVPLRSGGMIYIGAEDRLDIQPKFPIGVEIPTRSIDEGMELYKGEEAGDSVNWVKEDSLQNTMDSICLEGGKQLFLASCNTCHSIRTNKTGPALGDLDKRGPWNKKENIYSWVANPAAFIPTTLYTRELQKKWGSIMPSFPMLSENEMNCLLNFIMNESGKAITDTFYNPKLFANSDTLSDGTNFKGDSCFTYEDTSIKYINTIPEPSEIRQEDSIAWEPSMRAGFSDGWTLEGYKFEIKTLGWYNVDAEFPPLNGAVLVNLDVKISNIESQAISVYAFFPQFKNLSVGTQTTKGWYEFKKLNGKIPLFPGEKGIVLAFGAIEEQVYWGSTTFNVKAEQTITVDLKASSQEALLEAIKKADIEGIDFDLKPLVKVPCGATRPAAIQ